MKESTIQQCIRILLRDWKKDQSRPTYHYAFAIKKNRILAVGKNKPEYPSKKAFVLGRTYSIQKWQVYPYLHAESDLVTKLNDEEINRQLELLSLRINRHGEFRLAKPCHNCQKLLDQLNINKITWSCNTPDRKLNTLILQSQHKISVDVHNLTVNPLASEKTPIYLSSYQNKL
jgi:deoxycytidylate deaminase